MKTFKRISAMFMVFALSIMVLGYTTAFAAESTTPTYMTVPASAGDARSIICRQINKDSFNISTTNPHAGYSFNSTSNELLLEIKVSDSSHIVAVRLHDQTTNQMVGEWQLSSGKIEPYVNVTKGHDYICEYLVASGSGWVTVTNTIYAVFR